MQARCKLGFCNSSPLSFYRCGVKRKLIRPKLVRNALFLCTRVCLSSRYVQLGVATGPTRTVGSGRGRIARHIGHDIPPWLESTHVCKQSLSKLCPHGSATGSTSTCMHTTLRWDARSTLIQPNCYSDSEGIPGTVYTPLSYPAILFDWLITLTLTLINCDNIIL